MTLEIGKTAPSFTLASDEGDISLSDLKGQNVVLYFYPKDNTPGCTIQAQDFTKKSKEFEKKNCVILGVSRDSVKKHCGFIEKHNLSFNLLADIEGEVCNKYEVLKEKSMFGKKYVGIDRSTFLIDRFGKISQIWRGVKVNGHVEEVLRAVSEIKK